MREWYKYSLDPSNKGRILLPIDHSFCDHEKAMGGYKSDAAYTSKSTFFNKYFFGYHGGRLEYYDNFLRKHLGKNLDTISIASGRCANELYLMEDDYRITCSGPNHSVY